MSDGQRRMPSERGHFKSAAVLLNSCRDFTIFMRQSRIGTVFRLLSIESSSIMLLWCNIENFCNTENSFCHFGESDLLSLSVEDAEVLLLVRAASSIVRTWSTEVSNESSQYGKFSSASALLFSSFSLHPDPRSIPESHKLSTKACSFQSQ